MTDEERAVAIIEQFRLDGHPFYDELVDPISAALAAVRRDERNRIVACLRDLKTEVAARRIASLIERGEHGS